MLNCSKCETPLNEENSLKRYGKRKNKINSYCKLCFNKYVIARRYKIKEETIKKFGNKCNDCNLSFPAQVYDFHHLDPTQKDYDWNRMRQISKQKREEELSKCIMVCANCHRIRHLEG